MVFVEDSLIFRGIIDKYYDFQQTLKVFFMGILFTLNFLDIRCSPSTQFQLVGCVNISNGNNIWSVVAYYLLNSRNQ